MQEEDVITIEPESLTPRQQFIDEMRRVLQVLEDDPTLPLPDGIGSSRYSPLSWYAGSTKEAARVVRALGAGGWSKNDPNKSEHHATYLIMEKLVERELYLRVMVSREGICEKKVVGKKTEKVRRLVQEAVYEEVYEEVDDVKIECGSLLSVASKQEMSELEEMGV